jgi:hypothetical protein
VIMNAEYMGWFGFSWQEKVAAAMYKILGSDYKSALKKPWQPGGYNIDLVDSIYNGYVLSGFKDATDAEISAITEVEVKIIQAFRLALSDLAIKGDIPYKYYDPETVRKSTVVKSDVLTPEPVKKIEMYVKIGAALAGGFLLLQALSYLPKGATHGR